MSIRAKYVRIVKEIAECAGISGLPPSNTPCKISPKATRQVCIQYTRKFVVGMPGRDNPHEWHKPHYRYDRYHDALSLALDMIASRTEYRGPQLHIDMGCGPGLFTWVVRDIFRHEQIVVDLYGYDRANKMVEFATEIWTELDESVDYACYYNAHDMLSVVSAQDNNSDHALVTFGHVLAQNYDKKYAIRDFGHIIHNLVGVNCLVVAVDAKYASTKFRKGCDRLEHSLLDHDLKVDVIHNDKRRYIANVTR